MKSEEPRLLICRMRAGSRMNEEGVKEKKTRWHIVLIHVFECVDFTCINTCISLS